MKVLIIEDEAELSKSIASYLESAQYICEFADSYEKAIEKVESYSYDCILLDLMLPGGSGLKVLEVLKSKERQDGVIIISAKDAVEDKIAGLQMGADDYIAKPFHMSELAARIYSVIRRRNFSSSNVIRQNELEIDLLAKTVRVNHEPVLLTKKELDLLLYFIANKNKVVSKSGLAEHLSGDLADMLDNYDFVYAHIKNLKKKLNESGCSNYLKTVYGTGYKWQI